MTMPDSHILANTESFLLLPPQEITSDGTTINGPTVNPYASYVLEELTVDLVVGALSGTVDSLVAILQDAATDTAADYNEADSGNAGATLTVNSPSANSGPHRFRVLGFQDWIRLNLTINGSGTPGAFVAAIAYGPQKSTDQVPRRPIP